MKKTIDIAVDIETLSTATNAAIISIAAKPFSFEGELADDKTYVKTIDAASCVMFGLDIDKATIAWWQKQSEEAKKPFLYGYNEGLEYSLDGFTKQLKGWVKANDADDFNIWSQGAFDTTILASAYKAVGQELPWDYRSVRDARTYILEGVRMIAPPLEDPYSIIPPMEGWVKHNSESDVLNTIHNVKFIYNRLKSHE